MHRSSGLVASFLLLLCALTLDPTTVASPQRGPTTVAPARQTWTGRVCRPDGTPAEGAVVVTSAGGRALTAADGSFALDVELPRDGGVVEVTASLVGGATRASFVASTRLVPSAFGPSSSLGLLQLVPTASAPADWRATFGQAPGFWPDFGVPPFNGVANAFAVFDDGNGPALYVGGRFSSAGGEMTEGVARWDGTTWSALGDGVEDTVYALAVFDDGGGPALYAAGDLVRVGGTFATRIGKWDGASWSAIGGGTVFNVYALAVFDDGSGPALHAGGAFTTVGGVPANRVAKWDGSSWTALGSGTNSTVQCLTVFDDGSGPALYAGGSFTSAGGVAANRIAKWDGASWSALGSGLDNQANALAVFDDGSGPALCAGGSFTNAGGTPALHVAKWDGVSWSALGSGVGSGPLFVVEAKALLAYDDGSGPALFCAGTFTLPGRIAKWDGASWTALAEPFDSGSFAVLNALAAFDGGNGSELYVGGDLANAAGTPVLDVARWDGASWKTLGGGLTDRVRALVEVTDGSGPALYVGGEFTGAGGGAVNRIAKWDGASWSALGSGMDEPVYSLATFDDGSGPALHAGGRFATAGGVAANRIAKWNGTTWSALGGGAGGGPNRIVMALATYDDGSGDALYAGGTFTSAGGAPATLRIARWNGATWSSVGGGTNGDVRALAVFDDGGGSALYAGGLFTTAGGVPANCIARWDGSSWSALGSGLTLGTPSVLALAVYDDGAGPQLYAGGSFTNAGGVSAHFIARWDGASWQGLPSGDVSGAVLSLTVCDDGGGPALYAGGEFTVAGFVIAPHVARWRGSSWSALGSGVNAPVDVVLGTPRGLYVGGRMSVSPAGDSFLAHWGARRRVHKEE